MNQANPMAEDMFEKAREAFFGATKPSPKPNAPSAERLKPRNEPSLEEAIGLSPDKHRAVQPVAFTYETT